MKLSVIALGLVVCCALGATPKWEMDAQCQQVEIDYPNARLTVARDKMDGGFYPEFVHKTLPGHMKTTASRIITVNGISSYWFGDSSEHFSPEHEMAGVIVLSDLFKGRLVTVEYGDFNHTFSGEGFREVFKKFIKCSEVPNGPVAQ
ncbi:MAG: hypothetical protein ACRDCY_18000 [Aeromonas veronii]